MAESLGSIKTIYMGSFPHRLKRTKLPNQGT
jgi:hypothetical protein